MPGTIIKSQLTNEKTETEITQVGSSRGRSPHIVWLCVWLKGVVSEIHCQSFMEMLFKSQMKRSRFTRS